jgi:hypothetical protein
LALLGVHDRPGLTAIERLTSGGLLISALVFGPAALGLVDAKNDACGLIRGLLDKGAARIGDTAGRERYELIVAAHTTLVLSAAFEALRDEIGPLFATARLTDAEKIQLARPDLDDGDGRTLVDTLLALDVSMPSVRCGFEENLRDRVTPRLDTVVNTAITFLTGLDVWEQVAREVTVTGLRERTVRRAVRRYRNGYLTLAGRAREFFIWMELTEHGATRGAIRAAGEHLMSVLNSQSNALGKLHDLLALAAPDARPDRLSVRGKLTRAAAAVLDKPLLRSASPPTGINFPTVHEGFVTPRFKLAVAGEEASVSQEEWWLGRPARAGLDEFLAAHLAHPDAAQLPLIVLGHPGAGKSLLTEVMAARLPAGGYTVVPVQLRRVNADDRLPDQIDQALKDTLHEPVPWGRLADECQDTVRVVILDGFDELVQATGTMQSGYLTEVRRFQEQELDLGRPVAVVVTSRTLVVDRARIPNGCLVVKLEDFDDGQVGGWIDAWNRANRENPRFRRLDRPDLLRYGELARQPLLLMLLAMYATGPDADRLDFAVLSEAALYERLLDSFIRRQVVEKPDRPPAEHVVARLLADHRWQLSLAAFAMFNRGSQQVTDAELDRDLDAMLGHVEASRAETIGFGTPVSRAQRTVASFFFVHVARADEHLDQDARRTYEFLHATFGEYLTAERTVRLIQTLTRQRLLSEADPAAPEIPDDSLLRALLSHQPLLRRAPIVEFARQLFATMDAAAQRAFLDTVAALLAAARTWAGAGRYDRYEPTPYDAVGRIAAYTANLVTLRVLLPGKSVPVRELAPAGVDPAEWWRSTVRLWHSGLAPEAWKAVVSALQATTDADGSGITVRGADAAPLLPPTSGVYLLADAELYCWLQVGATVWRGSHSADPAEEMLHLAAVETALDPRPDRYESVVKLVDQVREPREATGLVLAPALARDAGELPFPAVATLVRALVGTGPSVEDLVSVVAAHPRLLDDPSVAGYLAGSISGGYEDPRPIVTLWRTEQSALPAEGADLKRLRETLEARLVVAFSHQDLSGYPVEFLAYLLCTDTQYPPLSAWQLGTLAQMPPHRLARLAPHDAVRLLDVIDPLERSSTGVRDFARRYLDARGAPPGADDPVARLIEYATSPVRSRR